MAEKTEEGAPKKASKLLPIAVIVVLTLIGAGGGWVVGAMVAPPPETPKAEVAVAEPAAAAHEGGKEGEAPEIPKIATEANGVVLLEPVTTNLSYPSENWIRIEVALQFKGTPDVTIAEAIHQDIAAYMKTVSLQQIQGPRGFQYLKDDIKERVDLRSEGRVTNVMFRTFVVQ
ncbi:flagellar basal body-associated FliL family protein [Ensifer soli]|uniref:flagellar basal body-associated FliL family protein n=1 Tax=Ciceribacter sp. sgz301302 TaxID=3342379 RepID=UPI0035BABC3E